MPDWIGKTIGKVRIEKLLARGGMAEVYLGSHLTLDRPVAVKVLHSYIEEEPILLERFQREAKVVAGLRQTNIVQIFDFDTTDGHPYIVMEYLKGPTLAAYLRYLHQRKKRIPSDQVARLLKGLSGALDYAHGKGVIHRDIKPSNILLHNKTDEISLDKSLTNEVEAIVTDFGLVRLMDAASQTASGMAGGTPAYMSPEQARGDETDHRTDIYSLGVVLYEMLAGRVPFEADSTMTVLYMHIHTPPPPIPGIPARVQAVMDRALMKNPDDRYQTSQQMAADFYLAIGMTTQAEMIRESDPVIPMPIGVSARPMPEPPKEPELQTHLEPTRQPARSQAWIGVGLFALAVIYFLAAWAFRIPPFGSILAPTKTLTPTPSPAASPLPSEPPIPSREGMVQVPAGTYHVGRDPEDLYHNASQSITLEDFWIDKYQVTNEDYQRYLPAWTFLSGEEKHPAMGVTWEQADAYCQSKNKRLPDEAEWEAAGRGGGVDPPLFPWGINDYPNLPNDTYDVGSQTSNVSPFNVSDMLGNVYEWVGKTYGGINEPKHVLRGARSSNPVPDLSFRVQVAPDDTTYAPYAGFRCASYQVR